MVKAKRKVACFTREGQMIKEYECAAKAIEDGYAESCVLTACDCVWGMCYAGMIWKYLNK